MTYGISIASQEQEEELEIYSRASILHQESLYVALEMEISMVYCKSVL